MSQTDEKWSMHDRVAAVFQGKKPDRLPFIDRIDFWYKQHSRAGTIPEEYKGMSEAQIHKAVGIGHEKWEVPYTYKYHGVEVISCFNGDEFFHEVDPELDFFPILWYLVPMNKAGVTVTEFITPVGKLSVEHEVLEEMILSGNTRPHLKTQLIKDEADFKKFEYMLASAEYIPRYDRFFELAAQVGNHGYLVPWIERTPFQNLLYDVFGGGEKLFYALFDNTQAVERLLQVHKAQVIERLHRLADFQVPYVEFVDNLDGYMTSPRLFKKYVLPDYQEFSEILHAQGKKMGSHTDGNLKPLLKLIRESGLDVCESFTPFPITECTFEEAWAAWPGEPLIWGGIPSYYFEERISEQECLGYVESLLQLVGDQPIILGVGDAVMGDNLIERVRSVAQIIEAHPLR